MALPPPETMWMSSTVVRSTGRLLKVMWVAIAGGVGSIGIDLRDILALAQEVERHLGVSLFPVGQRANIPILAAPSGQRDVPHGQPVDHPHLVPCGGHLLDEVEGLLSLVLLRIVRHHFQRALKDHVQRQLLRPCPQGHRHVHCGQ